MGSFWQVELYIKNREIPINLKRKVFDTCTLPVATYGLEIVTMTKRC